MDEDGLLTALPGSMDPETGRWRVTAFVTPRLDPGGDQVELAEFPGFADWGEISGQLRLGLEFDSPGLVGTLDLEPDPSSPRPDPALWRTLFADVRVGTGTFQDLSGNSVASFPAAAVAQLVRSTYAAVAESSPTKLPPVTSGPLAVLHQLGEEMARDRDREASDHPMAQLPSSSPPPGSPAGTPGRYVDRDLVGSPTSDPGIGLTIREALRFYDRPGAADPLGPDIEPPPPPRPALDFHAFVSALADYPELLRRLGLALDFLIVDGEQIPAGPGRVRFDPFDVPVEWPRRPEARPWTQYEVVDRRFIARPLEGEEELVDGSLRVESSRFFLLEQIDIDGAALKVANTARTIVATRKVVLDSPGSETVAPSMTPDESSLPALRGSGLTLYRDRRARKIVHGWDNAKGQDAQHTAGTELDLFADDVTRGYRLDVAELAEPDTWFSLQARVGAYALRTAVPGERLALPVADPIRPDEGYVKAASASHNAAEPDVAYIHEAIAGWEGWSLAAPRPGNRIGQHRVEPPDDPAAEAAGFPLPLEVTFRPQPGSLPRLRFGRSYRMRARLVDMAGRSVPPDFLDPNHVTPFTTFFRWDPVPAPVVVPRRPFTEGESGLRMVIRSTLDVTAAAYPDLPRITSLAGHTREDLAYRAVNERHLAAPIGSQQLAELHGRFDTAVRASSSTAERDAQFVIAARSAGTLLSPDDAGMITDGKAPPRPVELLIEDGRVVPHANLQGSGEYVLHDVNQLALPYLPDPLASAVSFTTLPGDGDTRVLDWPTDGRWFDRQPVLLRIEEGSGPPQWEPDARLLRVFLPQAEHVRVQLSSVLPREELTSMGVWMLERPAFREQQEEDAAFGRHWMLTPWDRLDLVHAVEKPLAPPVIKVADPPVFNSAVHRFLGETFASLTGTIANHAKSTGRLDLDASWIEPIDDPAQPTPQLTLPGQAHVGDFLLEPTEDECRIARNEFAPGPGQPPTHLVRHEFGDTKHRWVDYQATATTRFREYFPPAITDRELAGEDLIRHPGPALRLNVPSSHRPDPPQIEYVVPTWTWEERQIVGARARLGLGALGLLPTTVRTRIGGGLRVYLSRPWFSSGADELLGVVVRDQPWLTLPVDRDAGLLVSAEASQLADLAAERIIAAGLAEGRGAARLGSATRLLAAADAVSAAEPVVLARRTPTDDAQFTAHLAVLEGAGESAPAAVNAARSKVLTGVLDALAANDGVLEAELGGALADALIPQPHLTRWGADPAWAAPPISSGPYIHQFPLRSAVGTKISLPGKEKPATVVGHTPAFDEARGLWYCDLQIEAGSAYQPFVDLALVRYQPYSISGVHASSVVRPGFTQLVPDRTAALTPVALRAAWAVSLRGPSGYNELGQTYLFGSPPAAIVDASRELVAVVQTRPVGSDDLDWRPVGPEVRLHASGDDLADIRWHATVPRPELPPDNENRLVLTEYELFETDISQAETWVDRPAGGFGEARRKPAGRRLVFATEFTV